MASAILQIRSSLTDQVMTQAILPLMNSKLGFALIKTPPAPRGTARRIAWKHPSHTVSPLSGNA
jgi:hypothetical protein